MRFRCSPSASSASSSSMRILRLQHSLPFNPQGLPGLSPDLAFNTAVSFMTNTNWQAYGGETTLSYFSQMAGLTVQNFVSAAAGMAVCAAIIRGFFAREQKTLGNFWVDLTRARPLRAAAAFDRGRPGARLAGRAAELPALCRRHHARRRQADDRAGPGRLADRHQAARHQWRRLLQCQFGHPYENPTPLSNLIEMVSILLIPAAFCFMFGRMVKDMRQGVAIFAAMGILFLAALALTYAPRSSGNPLFAASADRPVGRQHGRQGSPLRRRQFRAVGHGDHGRLERLGQLHARQLHAARRARADAADADRRGRLRRRRLRLLRHAGLRRADRLPRRADGRAHAGISRQEDRGARRSSSPSSPSWSCRSACSVFGALAAVLPVSLSSLQNHGPHGLSEILYAYSSATGNNGSAFAGFNADTPYPRHACRALPCCSAASSTSCRCWQSPARLRPRKTRARLGRHFPDRIRRCSSCCSSPSSSSSGGLTFFPALALGPVAEHFAMLAGQTF